MGSKSFAVAVTMMVCLLGTMIYVAWANQYGDFAKSPQTVKIRLGSKALVAGGKATLWFAAVELGAQVEIVCGDDKRFVELTNEPSPSCCGGIQVRLKEVSENVPPVATFEVTWPQ